MQAEQRGCWQLARLQMEGCHLTSLLVSHSQQFQVVMVPPRGFPGISTKAGISSTASASSCNSTHDVGKTDDMLLSYLGSLDMSSVSSRCRRLGNSCLNVNDGVK